MIVSSAHTGVMDPIVSADWLATQLDAPTNNLVVCHVGTTMTLDDPPLDFRELHLPGARYVSLDDLATTAGPGIGRHPLPSPEDFAATLGHLGIAEVSAVVGYDDGGGAFASRLVWMLRTIGQDAALLDGGLDAWTGPTESGSVTTEPVARTAIEWPADALADADAVAAHLDAGGVVIDSRAPERYRGETEPLDAVAGHVPGAINIPFAGNLSDGRFRPVEELVGRFQPATDAGGRAIVYCGSGVTACHNALAMEAAGLPRPQVYVGSWSGWSTEPGRAVERS